MAQALSYVTNLDITHVLMPEKSEYKDMLAEYRLRLPEPRDLLPAMGTAILFALAEERGLRLEGLKAAVIAPRLSHDAITAAHVLSRRVKSLALCGGADTELMAR